MSPFDLGALLLLAAAVIGLVNDRWIGLPQPVCLLLGSIAVSLGIMAIDTLFPQHGLTAAARSVLEGVDLPRFLLDGVLAFLLFAASLHVSFDELRTNKWTILVLATGGVIISTVLFGMLLWAASLAGRPRSRFCGVSCWGRSSRRPTPWWWTACSAGCNCRQR